MNVWLFFIHLFDTEGFVRRWICGSWSGGLGWTHIVADVAIFAAYAAYAAIPAMLVFFIRKKTDAPFLPIYGLFAAFILSCGLTHLIEASLFWHPWYRLSALFKVLTAVASWITVFALFRAIPPALALPGLAIVNQRLTEEIANREEAEAAFRETEQRLRLATDASDIGIWQWEVESDVVAWENDWPYEILGIERGTKPVNAAQFANNFVHPEDRSTFEKAVIKAMTSREHFAFRGRIIRPDGALRWVDFRGGALLRKGGGPHALIGTARDITQRILDEEALRKAHDRLENVLGSITDGLAVMDKDWCYTYFNQQGADLIGMRREDLLGRNMWELFPHTEGTLFQERYYRAVRTGTPQHFEEYYPEPLNKWIECHCYPSPDGLSVYFHDVTARVQSEQIVKHNVALFSNLVDLAPLGMYVVDSQLRMKQINPLALPTFAGIEPLIGRDFNEVMEITWGPTVGPEVVKIFRHTLDTGETYVSPPFVHDRHDLGVEQAFDWQTQRVTLPNGEYAVVCYFMDVTEERKTQQALVAGREALRKRTEELETLLDTVPVCVWLTMDADCDVITGNRTANELTQTPVGLNISQKAAAKGKAPYLKQLKEDGMEYRPEELPLQMATATGKPVLGALLDFRFSDGRIVKALGNAVPLFDETGRVRGGIAAFHDITALKQAEAELIEARRNAEAANQAKDHFLAMISHELRTPLNPALMTISFLEKDPALDAEIREDVTMVRRNLELEVKLIDDLLDVSRITMGKMVLELTKVNLAEVVNDVVRICRDAIKDKKVQVITELTPEVTSLTADSARLQQILWNVLRNAIKFAPEGGTIRISSARLTPQLCEVRIQDSGMGIAPEKLPLIFAAFEQGEDYVTQQYGGLGLGLAISRALVEMHGGTIRAESAGLNLGATFIVELPG